MTSQSPYTVDVQQSHLDELSQVPFVSGAAFLLRQSLIDVMTATQKCSSQRQVIEKAMVVSSDIRSLRPLSNALYGRFPPNLRVEAGSPSLQEWLCSVRGFVGTVGAVALAILDNR